MDNQLIGLRIRNARQLRQVTLEQVAASIGVNKSTIQRYEKGTIATPRQPVLRALAESLQVNYAWLTGESPDIEPVDDDDEVVYYLKILETRPDLRALLKHAEGAAPGEVEAVMNFFSALRGEGT